MLIFGRGVLDSCVKSTVSQGQRAFHVYIHTLRPKARMIRAAAAPFKAMLMPGQPFSIYNSLLLIRYLWEDESFMKFPATCLVNPMPSVELVRLAAQRVVT